MSESDVQKLNRKMDRILLILENDASTGAKGLVTQVTELKLNFYQFINKYNIDQAVKRGKDTVWKIVWGAVGAGLLTGIRFIVNLFLHI